jgi:hypothetical protein
MQRHNSCPRMLIRTILSESYGSIWHDEVHTWKEMWLQLNSYIISNTNECAACFKVIFFYKWAHLKNISQYLANFRETIYLNRFIVIRIADFQKCKHIQKFRIPLWFASCCVFDIVSIWPSTQHKSIFKMKTK